MLPPISAIPCSTLQWTALAEAQQVEWSLPESLGKQMSFCILSIIILTLWLPRSSTDRFPGLIPAVSGKQPTLNFKILTS